MDVGYITSPILVNEKYEIIDGQGRFEALKELDMPIEYIMQEGLGIKECVSMNVNQTNWTINDYIATYAKRGVESYTYFYNLQKEFPLITAVEVFVVALFNKDRLNVDEVASGLLSISREKYEEAREKLKIIYPIIVKHPKANRVTQIARGLLYCFDIKEIDIERIINKVEESLQENNIPPMATTSQVMQYLEKIYNENKRGRSLFLFTAYRENLELRDMKRRIAAKKGEKDADRDELSKQEEVLV